MTNSVEGSELPTPASRSDTPNTVVARFETESVLQSHGLGPGAEESEGGQLGRHLARGNYYPIDSRADSASEQNPTRKRPQVMASATSDLLSGMICG